MNGTVEPLMSSITAIVLFGNVVFAVSGALTAMRYRMDIMGVMLIGTITGIGGGTIRDLIIDRPVFWAQNPAEILICVAASAITFFFISDEVLRRRGMIWGDAMGLAAFGVAGCHIALDHGMAWPIAIFMGMITATGGGVIRDVITNTQPMIMCGQIYATAALAGASVYAGLSALNAPDALAQFTAFGCALALRAAAIYFDIRMGPKGSFITIGDRDRR